MIRIDRLSYRDLKPMFGDPETEEGKQKIKKSLISIDFPFPMNKGTEKILYCHEYIAEAVIDAFKEIERKVSLEFLKENDLDGYSGSYNHRKTRNGLWWSVHTWGLAVDLCEKFGKMGKVPMLPYWYVNAFIKRGFYWGGNWHYPDGMHFSACNG